MTNLRTRSENDYLSVMGLTPQFLLIGLIILLTVEYMVWFAQGIPQVFQSLDKNFIISMWPPNHWIANIGELCYGKINLEDNNKFQLSNSLINTSLVLVFPLKFASDAYFVKRQDEPVRGLAIVIIIIVTCGGLLSVAEGPTCYRSIYGMSAYKTMSMNSIIGGAYLVVSHLGAWMLSALFWGHIKRASVFERVFHR